MVGRLCAEDRKAQIVTEVLWLADEFGPDHLSTTDVARAVGFSQPAIFRHFPTKGAMWLAVAEDVALRLQDDWADAEAQAFAPKARLRALIVAQLIAISETPALPSILFSRELQVNNPALRKVFRGLPEAFQNRIVGATRDQEMRTGPFDHVSPEDLVILLTSLVQGVAIGWTLGARSFPLVEQGPRFFDIQMALPTAQEAIFDGETR